MEIIRWNSFVGRIVFLNAPRAMHYEDRREIQAIICLEFATVIDFFTMKELSRAIARATYREARARGWRKRRERLADGSIGKGVRWIHESHYMSENERSRSDE